MLTDILTSPLFIATIICFFIGSFSYIILRLWLLPVLRYRRIKGQVKSSITVSESDTPQGRSPAPETKQQLRQQATILSTVYNNALPYWYRLLLEKRLEDPVKAAALLMKFANTTDPKHAQKQAEAIRSALCLK